MMHSNIRLVTTKHLKVQAIAVLILVLFSGILFSLSIAWSLLLGGITCILPNSYFSWRCSRHTGAQNAKRILKDFYQGEIVKLMLTGLIFLLIFTLIPVTILAVFVGFITAHVAFWVSLLILRSERAVTKL